MGHQISAASTGSVTPDPALTLAVVDAHRSHRPGRVLSPARVHHFGGDLP
ncbi:hypothetical protein [Streptomyces ipomoeae]|nr:hypothetical protein [Streptomyces ipomoeae]MDX2933424.1 hypothetical protein [Streptomyces ipomoeae]